MLGITVELGHYYLDGEQRAVGPVVSNTDERRMAFPFRIGWGVYTRRGRNSSGKEWLELIEHIGGPVTLRAGGVYRSRAGEVITITGPMEGTDDTYTYVWLGSDGEGYMANGKYFQGLENSANDLVADITPGPVQP